MRERTSGRSLRRRWVSVPLPEPHLAGLVAGTILFVRRPWRLAGSRNRLRIPSLVCIWAGLLVIGWASVSVGERFDRDRRELVTNGPYAYSRNPMYVGWTILYVGVTLRANNAWMAVFLPLVAALTHSTVRREEAALEREFGGEYRSYRRAVPRYLLYHR